MAEGFKREVDFQDVIGTPVPPRPEIPEDPRVREIRLISNSVANALDEGKQDVARALLAEAGTCKWNEITHKMRESGYEADYSYDGIRETLHLSRLVNAKVGEIKSNNWNGPNGTIGQLLPLPRLSLTGQLCDTKK